MELSLQVWLEKRLSKPIPDSYDSLKDGILLCELLGIPHATKKGPFFEKERISFFIAECRKNGINEHDLFCTEDLHTHGNIKQVEITLLALKKVLENKKYIRMK